jgi:protein-arginine kinase
MLTQPAHLQKLMGRELSPEERDAARAELIRNRLSGDKETKKNNNRDLNE